MTGHECRPKFRLGYLFVLSKLPLKSGTFYVINDLTHLWNIWWIAGRVPAPPAALSWLLDSASWLLRRSTDTLTLAWIRHRRRAHVLNNASLINCGMWWNTGGSMRDAWRYDRFEGRDVSITALVCVHWYATPLGGRREGMSARSFHWLFQHARASRIFRQTTVRLYFTRNKICRLLRYLIVFSMALR